MRGLDVAAEARNWLDVRWLHQGRSREGVDCIGLVVCVRAALGLSNLDVSGYTREATDNAMLDFCRAEMREVARDEIQPGDILVQTFPRGRHMAIVTDYVHGGPSIVHAWLLNRKVVEMRLTDEFMADVRGCFRFPEVTA